MDDPTMRGYEQWWKQEQKREKKEPMIVDLDDGIVKPLEALVEFRDKPILKIPDLPEMTYGFWYSPFSIGYKIKPTDTVIITDWAHGYMTVNGLVEMFRHEPYEHQDCILLIVDGNGQVLEITHHQRDEPELSDPTDCPRCRGVKLTRSYLCVPCRCSLDEEEMMIYRETDVDKMAHAVVQYPMSFMAEKKEKDPDLICKRCSQVKEVGQILCYQCHPQIAVNVDLVAGYQKRNENEKQEYMERQQAKAELDRDATVPDRIIVKDWEGVKEDHLGSDGKFTGRQNLNNLENFIYWYEPSGNAPTEEFIERLQSLIDWVIDGR